MKKVGLIIVLLLCCISSYTAVNAEEKITVYIFVKDKEEISEKAMAYLLDLKETSELDFVIEKVVVWDENWKEDSAQRTLVDRVASYFDKEVLGAPIIVVGNYYFDEFSDEIADKLKEAIIEEISNENYTNVVANLSEAVIEEKTHSCMWSYIILGTSAVLILAFIIISRYSIKKDSI